MHLYFTKYKNFRGGFADKLTKHQGPEPSRTTHGAGSDDMGETGNYNGGYGLAGERWWREDYWAAAGENSWYE